MEEKNVNLSLEERELIEKSQKELKQLLSLLGSLRHQYVVSENNLLTKIKEMDTELTNLLKLIAKNKGIPSDENWFFDPHTFSFIKK
jgi:hypothetical protein